MKILHVINSLGTGGAEKLILDLVPELNKNSNICDLLLIDGKSTFFLNQLEERREVNISFISKNISLYNPLILIKLIIVVRKYDVVHAHLFPTLYWVSLAKLLSFSRVKIVYTEHSTNNRRRGKLIFKLLDKFIYNQYSKIVCITNEVYLNLNQHIKLSDKDKFIVLKNGVDLNKVRNAQGYSKLKLSFEDNIFLIIMVARFNYPKDQSTLIKSLKYLSDDVGVVLVGDGEKKQENELLVNQLGLEKRVKFLGLRTDVYSLLKTADVVVLSSAYEGLSLSSIEGMASGKPFVASRVPGIEEFVGNSDLLFSYSNEQELAKVINLLKEDSQYYNQVVNYCSERVKDYDIKVLSAATEELYKTL